MSALSELLHDLVDGTSTTDNRRGELHDLADKALTEIASVVAGIIAEREPETPPEQPANGTPAA